MILKLPKFGRAVVFSLPDLGKCGHAVLLKHSAQTPPCAERLQQAFAEAGLPEGVFQYLHLTHSDTEKVIQSPEVGCV